MSIVAPNQQSAAYERFAFNYVLTTHPSKNNEANNNVLCQFGTLPGSASCVGLRLRQILQRPQYLRLMEMFMRKYDSSRWLSRM